jgi:ABC-type Co2+ transport system permease subunit
MRVTRNRDHSFFRHHSLSIISSIILLCWIVLYMHSDPNTHWGSFFGNAIADWTGLVVTVVATKFMYEKGSAESRKPPHRVLAPLWETLQEHSLSIFLIVTGAAWIALFARSEPNSKWGQVVGNIVSEWTQIFGLVILTKKLIETHSKESNR